MAVANRSSKITVDLRDPELYHEVRLAALELNRSVRDIVVEALRQWLDRQEQAEDEYDIAVATEVLARDGERIPLQQIKDDLGV
jgi:hypothetical protein